MGYIDLDDAKITEIIQKLSNEFSGNTYNLLNRSVHGHTFVPT